MVRWWRSIRAVGESVAHSKYTYASAILTCLPPFSAIMLYSLSASSCTCSAIVSLLCSILTYPYKSSQCVIFCFIVGPPVHGTLWCLRALHGSFLYLYSPPNGACYMLCFCVVCCFNKWSLCTGCRIYSAAPLEVLT